MDTVTLVRRPAVVMAFLVVAVWGRAQSTARGTAGGSTPADPVNPPAAVETQPAPQDPRDDPGAFMRRMVLDSVGPYALSMAVFTAAIHQGTDNPPEWPQGAAGLSERFTSNMGITLVGNTTRYGLGGMLHQDTLYYRCRCAGAFARMRHAAFSAVVARDARDGSPVFSVADLASPYAATFTAVYAWYPRRYGGRGRLSYGQLQPARNRGKQFGLRVPAHAGEQDAGSRSP